MTLIGTQTKFSIKTFTLLVVSLTLIACADDKGVVQDARFLPAGSTNVISQGSYWKTFEFEGDCFLHKSSGDAIAVTLIPCKEK